MTNVDIEAWFHTGNPPRRPPKRAMSHPVVQQWRHRPSHPRATAHAARGIAARIKARSTKRRRHARCSAQRCGVLQKNRAGPIQIVARGQQRRNSENERGHQLRRPYSSSGDLVRPNSPTSQPVAYWSLRGSGRSQSKHRKVRRPLPPGGSARTRYAPQSGQVGRRACPMELIVPPVRNSVNQKRH
jgi:hypothetical protein